jgi:predicted nucleotidyltransferase
VRLGGRVASWPDFSPVELLQRLVAHGVDFVVVGGIAMVAHGSTRLTVDLDICYSADPTNLDVLGQALLELRGSLRGIGDEVPFVPDGRTLRRTTILPLDTTHGPLDLLAAPSGAPPYDELRRRAQRIDLDGVGVLVASLDDLAAMKAAAGRAKDVLDLEEIETIRRLRDRPPPIA